MRSLRPHLGLAHISRYARAPPPPRRLKSLTTTRLCSRCVPNFQNHLQPSLNDPPTSLSSSQSSSATSDPRLEPADLYKSSPYSPGSPLFTPAGAYIFNRLFTFLRAQYPQFGFQEVITPTIYKRSLWETSGHWENYAADMYAVSGRVPSLQPPNAPEGEEEDFGLKPMNCPGHCLLFAEHTPSYKDLPIRYADFGPLHRNENSGSLSGLTRVRRFHQDDGHIFCALGQVEQEIARQLAFVRLVYTTLNLPPFHLVLSTRPTDGSAIGTAAQWESAESHLAAALDASGQPWTTNPGDGAFYGPKIDIHLSDPTNPAKKLQTATIQLDFQLPARFDLKYKTDTGDTQRPVMIHRAVLGSVERFMHILLSAPRALPFWLNPRPLVVLTLNDKPETVAFAREVREEAMGLTGGADGDVVAAPLDHVALPVTLDSRPMGLAKKKAEALRNGYCYCVVVGSKEVTSRKLKMEGLQTRAAAWEFEARPAEGASMLRQKLMEMVRSYQ